jgi:hypothetical protein
MSALETDCTKLVDLASDGGSFVTCTLLCHISSIVAFSLCCIEGHTHPDLNQHICASAVAFRCASGLVRALPIPVGPFSKIGLICKSTFPISDTDDLTWLATTTGSKYQSPTLSHHHVAALGELLVTLRTTCVISLLLASSRGPLHLFGCD